MSLTTCVCGSGRDYQHCCAPLHRGEQRATSPEQLMRSRYAAFALGGLGAYLLRTWHPVQRPGLTEAELDQSETDWQRLEIVQAPSPQGDEGIVEFRAYYQEQGRLACLHERSTFRHSAEAGWQYLSGQINPPAQQLVKAGRNDPCPCGSGKKYKKCCGG
ncbi:YchJ family protein [Balneatrix alpica]|uniref:YchJ family protein n=1 Tax=Balneatrix alpica TaxID=75684 RepID=UPI002738CA2C|nr:YchJ family protein [Balneatrix alpica]